MRLCSTKAAISLKRVMIEKKLLLGTYRNSPSLFRTVPSPTPYGLPFHKIGVRHPHSKLQSLLSQEWVKLRTSNLATTITGSIRSKAHEKVWRKGNVGVSRDCQFFWFWVPPIIPGTGKVTDYKFGQYIQRVHPNKSPLKF